MTEQDSMLSPFKHDHVFLGEGHDRNARKTWAVIWLCGIMMVAEIVGGSLFGSLALVADGLRQESRLGRNSLFLRLIFPVNAEKIPC